MGSQEIKTEQKKVNKVEKFISDHTPQKVKIWLNKFVDKLPPKTAAWIRRHKFLTICIVYSIRGLFFRPSMWVLYGSIAAYYGLK
jgi:hypothetical protein